MTAYVNLVTELIFEKKRVPFEVSFCQKHRYEFVDFTTYLASKMRYCLQTCILFKQLEPLILQTTDVLQDYSDV